jgi:hypothetical protein
MLRISNITADALQKQTVVLADGTSFDITLTFMPMQYGWFITELVYGSVTITGLRVSVSPNMIHQFRNRVPFGIAVQSSGNEEPMLQEDFSSDKVKMYVLSQEEVAEYAAYLAIG